MRRKKIKTDVVIDMTPPRGDVVKIYLSRVEGLQSWDIPFEQRYFRHWIELSRETENTTDLDSGCQIEKIVSCGYYLILQWDVPDEKALEKAIVNK